MPLTVIDGMVRNAWLSAKARVSTDSCTNLSGLFIVERGLFERYWDSIPNFHIFEYPIAVRSYASAIARTFVFSMGIACDCANLTHILPLSVRFDSNQAAATFCFRSSAWSERNLKCFSPGANEGLMMLTARYMPNRLLARPRTLQTNGIRYRSCSWTGRVVAPAES